MDSNKPDFKAMLNAIRMLHLALALVLILFGAVILWLNSTNPVRFSPENQIFLYMPGISLLIAFPISSIVFKSQISQSVKKEMPLERKFSAFQSAHLIRMAFFEVAGMLSTVACLLTGTNYNIGILLIVLIMFTILTPSPSRLTLDLSLNMEEKNKLEND